VSRGRAAVGCAAVLAAAASAVALHGDEPRHADPLIVRVELEGASSPAEVATGFAVGPERIATVEHVLEPGRPLVIRRGGRVWRGRVLRTDAQDDLALLAVPGLRDVAAARLHRAAAAGTALRILVRRGGASARVRATLVRPVRATLHTPDSPRRTRLALQLSARVALGDSGAPVVDDDGRIAGVLFARTSNGSGTAYAVDEVELKKLLD
jgi:S1-C subfamily serine protease